MQRIRDTHEIEGGKVGNSLHFLVSTVCTLLGLWTSMKNFELG